jgi:hypothetical protein
MPEFFRLEFDITTQELTRVEQSAYSDAGGHFLVLDSVEPVPEGYTLYDGEVVPEEETNNL